VVLVEALVLDRDDGVVHPRRDLREGHDHPRLRAPQHSQHRRAVVRVDGRVRLRLRRLLQVERRDLRRDRAQQAGRERRQPEREEDGEEGEEPELADAPPFRGALFSAEERQSGR
jgi:hypothetical protein